MWVGERGQIRTFYNTRHGEVGEGRIMPRRRATSSQREPPGYRGEGRIEVREKRPRDWEVEED